MLFIFVRFKHNFYRKTVGVSRIRTRIVRVEGDHADHISRILLSNLARDSHPVWPKWVIYWTLGNFSKPVATISLPKSPTFLGNFGKDVKIFSFLVKSLLGNFYRHLATFYRSHLTCHKTCYFVLFSFYQYCLAVKNYPKVRKDREHVCR